MVLERLQTGSANTLPMSTIKKSSGFIIELLLHIINFSLTSGIFPSKLTIAKMVPAFKVDDPCLIENYRLVSILPAFSKIFEKIVYNHISRYLTENMILSKYQFGFQEKHSTSHAPSIK